MAIKPGEKRPTVWSGRRTRLSPVCLLLFYVVPSRKVNTPGKRYFEREVLKLRFCKLRLQEAVAFYKNIFPQAGLL